MKNKLHLILTGAGLFICAFGYSQSIRYVAPTGSDASNDCSLPGSPCQTVAAAYQAAIAGDTIKLADGTYTQTATLSIEKSLVITALTANTQPILTTSADILMAIDAADVTVSNLKFELGLTATTGRRGIHSTGNFANLKVDNVEFASTQANAGNALANYEWSTFAISLSSPTVDAISVELTNNVISATSTTNAFGRGIYLGTASTFSPGGTISGNTIVACYPLQIQKITADLSVTGNSLKGINLFTTTHNAANVSVQNNTFNVTTADGAHMMPDAIHAQLDVREMYEGSFVVENNTFSDFSRVGILASTSTVASYIGNTFNPLAAATDFAAIMATNKLMTSGAQATTTLDELVVKGNTFNAGTANVGTAILFANHYAANTPSYGAITIGGPTAAEKNTFDANLANYIRLDTLSGPSTAFTLWASYAATTMAPFNVNFQALMANNNYNLTSYADVQGKIYHQLDSVDLGLVTIALPSENRYVATTGTDVQNDCATELNPCKTIYQAVISAQVADTIFIADGTYAETAILTIADDSLTIMPWGTATPIITTNQSTVFDINAKNVTIDGLEMQLGLTATTGLVGIESTAKNFNNVTIKNNTIVSTAALTESLMEWTAFAIRLHSLANTLDTVTIEDNTIGTTTATNNAFGRGIYMGSGSDFGAAGTINNNNVTAFYSLQLVQTTGDLTVEDNTLTGIMMVNAPLAGVTVAVKNNEFDLVDATYASNFYAQLDVRAIEAGDVIIEDNLFKNYSNIALFSNAAKNVTVLDNVFTPFATAQNFNSIMVNTKLMTNGVQGTTYANEITLKGNTFNAGATGTGTAVLFADHYGVTAPAFNNIVIGGATAAEKNTFNATLGQYIVMDSKSALSNTFPLWANYAVTTMKPVSDNITALFIHNNYNYPTVAEVEARNVDSLDNPILGKIILEIHHLSVDKLSASEYEMYPNPTTEAINIVLTAGIEEARCTITDLSGKVVFEGNINQQSTIQVGHLTQGVYIATLAGKNFTSSARFIKK